VHLWDTAGEEKFRAMLSLYYRDASAAVIVYDITQSETFQSVRSWLSELDEKI
jgi:Ras-related protein Rab-5C